MTGTPDLARHAEKIKNSTESHARNVQDLRGYGFSKAKAAEIMLDVARGDGYATAFLDLARNARREKSAAASAARRIARRTP